MSKGSNLIGGAVLIGILFAACSGHDDKPTPSAAPSSTVSTPSYSASTPSYVPTAPAADYTRATADAAPPFAGEAVTVTDIVDGDTFKTSDGRTIRALGIDSCEAGTYGGDLATSDARLKLTSTYDGPVTITSEPGVDKDKYGRQLRYVQFGSNHEDFGEYMVRNDHTGVYQGENDASPEYVARLYSLDTELSANPPSGRECGDPYPSTPSSGGNSYSYDGDDDYNMPDGALTGGYCARKWWC